MIASHALADSAPAARMANFPLPIDYPHNMHLANLPLAKALQSLGTTATGLTTAEAARRLRE